MGQAGLCRRSEPMRPSTFATRRRFRRCRWNRASSISGRPKRRFASIAQVAAPSAQGRRLHRRRRGWRICRLTPGQGLTEKRREVSVSCSGDPAPRPYRAVTSSTDTWITGNGCTRLRKPLAGAGRQKGAAAHREDDFPDLETVWRRQGPRPRISWGHLRAALNLAMIATRIFVPLSG